MRGGDHEPDVDRLPIDLLAQIFALFTSFKDMAQTLFSLVKCKLYIKGSEEKEHVSRAASLQHLNVGGTFITDASLFAVADSCPHLKTIVLWGCRHVTEKGLLVLVNKCHKLESINVWGMRIPASCFVSLLTISPALQIQPKRMLLDDERFSMWPVY
ncbi:UNVERIFIED_CONTAM: F-box protein [Sesamum angustifolium]|uniref:F-box protein n=1 Tax=Sesamum angustifolium TaxID=2727405 RepID=A0AAW2NK50_9LAMI